MDAVLGSPLSPCQIESHGNQMNDVQQCFWVSAMVPNVHAPDSAKDFEEDEKFMGS